ncbi:CHAT domain-containing protein [Embleya sp. NPDC001921]
MDVDTAAEASWDELISLTRAFDARVRWDSRETALIAAEGLAAETAWYQYRANLPWKAAQALEGGRAMLLGRLIGVNGPAELGRLRDVRQDVLLLEYLAAQRTLASLLRSQAHGDIPPAPPTVTLGGVSFGIRTGDPLADAHARLRELEVRIAHILGTGVDAAGPGMIPRPELLQTAAGRHGPLVYLAAAQAGGLAVTITPDRPPAAVRLPALTREETGRLTAAVRQTASSRLLPGILGDALELLTKALRPVYHPPGTDTITVIGAGPMALLPLGAALRQAIGAGLPTERGPAVRHAPSARLLLHAGRTTAAPETVLITAVRVAARFRGTLPRELKRADIQATALTRLYSGRRVVRAATTAEVRRGARLAGTLHFHCHGHADDVDPLDSALLLADGALSVRDLIAADALAGRLVVLCACEGAAVSAQLPDEALGFPGVLLQAGARCVVASLWKTGERAATLLLHRFHLELHHNHRTPPHALAVAQDWLRTATPEELATAGRDIGNPRDALMPARFASPEHWAGWTCTAG